MCFWDSSVCEARPTWWDANPSWCRRSVRCTGCWCQHLRYSHSLDGARCLLSGQSDPLPGSGCCLLSVSGALPDRKLLQFKFHSFSIMRRWYLFSLIMISKTSPCDETLFLKLENLGMCAQIERAVTVRKFARTRCRYRKAEECWIHKYELHGEFKFWPTRKCGRKFNLAHHRSPNYYKASE